MNDVAATTEKLFGTGNRELAHRIREETFVSCSQDFARRWARHVRLYRQNGGFTPAKSNYLDRLMDGWESGRQQVEP